MGDRKLPDNVALAPPEDSDGLQTGFMLANITYAAGVIMCQSRQLIGKPSLSAWLTRLFS